MKSMNNGSRHASMPRLAHDAIRNDRRQSAVFTAKPAIGGDPDVGADRYLLLAETHYAARRRRERFLGADLLGEPAWDILLDLYISWKRGQSVSTSSACLGAHVPATTALRWLQVLQDRGLIERFGDDRDQRRTLVRLSRQGVAVLEGYFEANWSAFDGDEMADRLNAVASHREAAGITASYVSRRTAS